MSEMLLSIDPGIRNLGICCVQLDLQNGKHPIVEWQSIDLLCLSPSPNCAHDGCTKSVKYTLGDLRYCVRHAKATGCSFAPEQYESCKKRKRLGVRALKALASEVGFPADQTLTKQDLIDHVEAKCLLKIGKPLVSAVSEPDVAGMIVKALGSMAWMGDVKIVLIENQIGPMAVRMRSMQAMLTMYFVCKWQCRVVYVNASNKLKNFDVPKKTYRERKTSAIDITRRMVSDTGGWAVVFASSQKKDDLADSFLQALWYVDGIKCSPIAVA